MGSFSHSPYTTSPLEMQMTDTQFQTITKTFDRLVKAEKFQDRLYDKYNSVQLLRSPMFSEDGVYAWRVSGPVGQSKSK
jgi:hypothetical protein